MTQQFEMPWPAASYILHAQMDEKQDKLWRNQYMLSLHSELFGLICF